ncbi:hypothetical protein SPSYN_01192 [Sporotomaculum syntrophicum]|uniref:Copper amine oxidase-like N-terminal domain-containing protein n=1 Tax=Sporotomaculum syntrophicum TaxID=182264 RepID=A0A9D2WQH2_9FIRM|nr:copper amine oxidase N-terminal domain-containing protein [Sporotomaculum syntrophicum]KAF1085056.1 hypothetical protein SPSYN_01192 [Sporotomaculum syntrophicum]
MKFRKFCAALTISTLLVAPSLCFAEDTTEAGTTVTSTKLQLTLGSSTALLNNVPYQLEIPPVVVDGVSYLPIRFVTEQALGAAVQWEAATNTVQINKGATQIKFSLTTGQAMVNNQEVELSSPPFVKDGRTLVPLRFLAENFNVQVDFDPSAKTITITKQKTEGAEEEPINLPPVITSLGLQSDVLKIGEEAKYNFSYDNEVGESITAQEWSYRLLDDTQVRTGQPRAFFRPGTYVLSLRLRDAAGNWSDTATTNFTVANEKLMSEMVFKLSRPVYGELFENLDNVKFNTFTANANTTFERTGTVLHLSNSPEIVSQPGILYQSEASGNFRLFYHHANGADEKQYLYVIAENNNLVPVTLKTIKSGEGGPVNDYMNLGQAVSMRYLSSQGAPDITINPGEKLILNQGMRFLNKGEAVTGMQDYQADGTITLSVIMGPEKAPEPEPTPETDPLTYPSTPAAGESSIDDTGVSSGNAGESPTTGGDSVANRTSGSADNSGAAAESAPITGSNPADSMLLPEPDNTEMSPMPPVKTPAEILREKIDYLLSLPVLPRNQQQVRGVFPTSDCLVNIQAGSNAEKITLGLEEPGHDSWVEGIDPLTGETIRNIGNYGVIYRVKITAPEKTGVMLNPRGSIFKAAFQAADGQVYKVPETGHFTGLQKAAILGVLEAGQTKEFIYTPPSGSDTPLIIALLPENTWSTFDQ